MIGTGMEEVGNAEQGHTAGGGANGASIGPPVYANWVAASRNHPVLETDEFRLLTDAWVSGEEKQGPYLFLNTVVRPQAGLVQPAVLLRVDLHLEFPTPDMTRTDAERYHGGTFPEEVAALSSLALGIRLKAGNMTRSFVPGGDPKGTPLEWGTNPVAAALLDNQGRRWVVPGPAEGLHPLDALSILSELPRLSAAGAVALVRAARLYQDALWLVELEPELGWLMLVSAIETASNHWGRAIKESASDRMRDSKPELYKLLEDAQIPELLDKVAEQIADSLGSTRKFIGFVMQFLPPAPEKRPPVGFQFRWDQKEMKKVLGVVYKYRSKALHEGTPFPYPMCSSPFRDRSWEAPSEVPVRHCNERGHGDMAREGYATASSHV